MRPEQDPSLRPSSPPPSESGFTSSSSQRPSTPLPPINTFNPPVPPPPSRKKRRFGGLNSIISTVLLFLVAPVIALSIAAFVVQSYEVDGQSMEPTLQDNDRLIVDKWQRSWSRITHNNYVPARGDIIIFNQSGLDFAGSGTKQLIKRVMGLPGERVVVNNGSVTIYNNEHSNGFSPDSSGRYRLTTDVTSGNVDLTLGNDEIFVCGDNRGNSEDSRYFGPVKVSQIVGKLAFRIVPLNKAQKF